MAPRETENNAYAKYWGDKQRALWYAMVFSGVVNCALTFIYFYHLGQTARAPTRYFLNFPKVARFEIHV